MIPKVGDKHYTYDRKGLKAAADASKESGQPIEMSPRAAAAKAMLKKKKAKKGSTNG